MIDLERRVFCWKLVKAAFGATFGGLLYNGLQKVIEENRSITKEPEYPQDNKAQPLEFRIDDDLTSDVNKNIKRLLGDEKQRSRIEESFSRTTALIDYFKDASDATRLNISLIIGVCSAESDTMLRVVSNMGAAGPMQLMPLTTTNYGLGMDDFKDERFSPDSIITGSYFLLELIKRSNLMFGLARYNMGPKPINGNEWKDIKLKLPQQTRDFVIKVLSRQHLWENSTSYGLNVTHQESLQEKIFSTTNYMIRKGDNLTRIAEAYKTKSSDLITVNPEIINYGNLKPNERLRVPIKT